MSPTGSMHRNLSCPECGSNYTQSIAIAYARSVRTSDSGYESISVFGKSIAPPQERDEKVRPTIVACFTAAICLLLLPDLFDRSGIQFLLGLRWFNWPVILGAASLAGP